MTTTDTTPAVRVFQLHRTADCIGDIETIHGHDGATRVVMLADLSKGSAAWNAA